MHPNRNKVCLATVLTVPGLTLFALLVGCQERADVAEPAEKPQAASDPTCSQDAYLSTDLYGSIEREIHWAAPTLRCESMLRPDGKGVRLRFTGTAAGSQLAIILALPELQRGVTVAESPTVVTLTVEGSGRFFSTASAESCWSDISAQTPVADGAADRFAISGTLYCVSPLGEINGDAAISIPKMNFRSIVDWSAE